MSYDLNHSFAKPIENLPDTKPSLFINRNFIFLFNSFPFLYLVCLISKKSWWNSTKTLVYHGLSTGTFHESLFLNFDEINLT